MIKITARGFELKQGAKNGIEKELKRIEKMLPETASFDVTLAKIKDGYKCDITVVNVGSFIRGEAEADRIEPAVDMTVDDLKRKLRKLKTNIVEKKRKGRIDELADAFAELEEEVSMEDFERFDASSAEIKRIKKVTPNMMTDDEAIVQMEMLGHSFFVYLGVEGDTRIIYARNKGYGLLICE
ncbi:MAG: ribosome-associated translation inhibitor RaiA [Clostridiales bacterium]|nr:ribosome-associated translation inhibitor RaiA [Clostridiales bacterium]